MPAGKTRTVLVPIVGEDGRTILEVTRIRKGFTLSGLSKASGVSTDALWRFEQDALWRLDERLATKRRRPRPSTAKRIADALGEPLETLFAQVST